MNNFEEQIEQIKKHFEEISEEELNFNLEKCGVNEIQYDYMLTMEIEELSNIEMNHFIEISKEEMKWETRTNNQAYAA